MIWLWGKIRGWLLGAVFALAAILGVYLKGRQDGSEAAERKSQGDLLEDIKTNKEVRDEISGLGDDALSDRLRRWVPE